MNDKSHNRDTALMVAALAGFCVKDLLHAGADVNAQNTAGVTALMILAAQIDADEISEIKDALKAGADVSLQDAKGRTALDYLRLANSSPGHCPIPATWKCGGLEKGKVRQIATLLRTAKRNRRRPGVNPQQQSASASAPTTADEMSTAELRYRVMQYFVPLWFCGSNPRLGALPEDEEEAAVRAFPKICKDEKTFRTITRHLNLGSVVEFSDEQKLTIYREYKRLEAISLESWKGKYRFNVLVPAEPRIWTRSGGFRTMPDPERNEGFRVEGTVDFDGQVTILKKEEVVLKCPALRCVGRRP